MDTTLRPRLRRPAAAEFLTSRGYPTRTSTLSWLAGRDDGPKFLMYGKVSLYSEDDLLAWAEGKLAPPRHLSKHAQSHSEGAAA
jgi:hypothetical protein